MKIHKIIYVWLGLQLADLASTYFALKVPGVVEMNPLPAIIGWGWMVALKLVLAVFCAYLVNAMLLYDDFIIRKVGAILAFFNVSVMSIVVINNTLTAILG